MTNIDDKLKEIYVKAGYLNDDEIIRIKRAFVDSHWQPATTKFIELADREYVYVYDDKTLTYNRLRMKDIQQELFDRFKKESSNMPSARRATGLEEEESWPHRKIPNQVRNHGAHKN